MKNLFSCALAPVLFCGGLLVIGGAASAQETLAGMGAAGAMGATLGATAGGSMSGMNAARGVGRGGAMDPESETSSGDPRAGSGAGDPRGGGGGGEAGAAKAPPVVAKALNWGRTGQQYISELVSAPRVTRPIPERVKRTSKQQAAYSKRIAKLTPTQRKKLVMQKYKIPPRNWLASYLPQDRYKFGKVWKFVSTETSPYYFTPSEMTRLQFNPNRVIGFNSYQDALIAGYRPDPVSKPAPGNALAVIAGFTRGPELYTYAEYLYSGQISPAAFNATYAYILRINNALKPVSYARPYIPSTVAKVLEASITGDTSIIPTSFESPAAMKARAAQAAREASMSTMGGSMDSRGSTDGSMGGRGSSGGDPRAQASTNSGSRPEGMERSSVVR